MGRSPSKSLHQDEIEEFALECGLDDERISKLYNQFDEIGELTYEEFRRRTKVKDNPFSRNLFESLNQNGKGKMNFREFLIGYAMLKDPQVSFHERAKLMFYILDHKKCGEISREDILLTLQDLLADFPEIKIQPSVLEHMVKETIRKAAKETLEIYKKTKQNPIHFGFELDRSRHEDLQNDHQNPGMAIYDRDKFLQFSRNNRFFSQLDEFF